MQSGHTDTSQELIVVPLFEIVVYPDSRTKFPVDRATGELLLAQMADAGSAYGIGLTVKSGNEPSELASEMFYQIGNLLRILRVQPADEGYLVFAQVVQRVQAISLHQKGVRFYVMYTPVPDLLDAEDELKTRILSDIRTTVQEISSRFPGSEQVIQTLDRMDSIDQIMGFVMPFLPVDLEEKQALLEIVSVRKRYLAFLDLLVRTREDINLRIEMAKKVSDRVNKSNREAMLREQLRVIQEELNESEGASGDTGYRERINNSKMPDEVRKKALAEVKKLENGGSQNHESAVIRNYLDLLLNLPWVTEDKKSIDIEQARLVLESHHNGLEKVKERIIQHLAVMKLKQEKQGSILLFAGPPGTG
ncbi:MAG: LON peptidase substrate-binding domain-containing protein, partial [Methanomicrobiales archaeon]|nr:LON peptidase substrate-binding domain-containing protein [Methanomicrobiales archaeon]